MVENYPILMKTMNIQIQVPMNPKEKKCKEKYAKAHPNQIFGNQ